MKTSIYKDLGLSYKFLNVLFQRYCRVNSTVNRVNPKSEESIKKFAEEDSIAYDKFIKQLLEIMVTNNIQIKPITMDELLSISSMSPLICTLMTYLDASQNGNTFYMDIDYEDMLLYNIMQSIDLSHSTLLDDVKYNDADNLEDFLDLGDTEDYLKLMKALKEAEPKNSTDIIEEEKDFNNVFELFIETFKSVLSDYLYENDIYGSGMVSSTKRLFTNKVTSISIFIFSRLLELLPWAKDLNSPINEQVKQKVLRYSHFLLNVLLKSMHGTIFSNSDIENDLIDLYNNYVTYYLKGLKFDSDTKGDLDNEDNPSNCNSKQIKAEIKHLRRELYKLRQKNKIKEEEQNSQQIESINNIPEEEIKSDIAIVEQPNLTIEEKIKLINDSNVLIITALNIFDNYEDKLNIMDAGQFKGKPINSKYKYVVKLTCGIKHHTGYTIDSEAAKINAKVITCSRTNVNLILDAIIKEL